MSVSYMLHTEYINGKCTLLHIIHMHISPALEAVILLAESSDKHPAQPVKKSCFSYVQRFS